MKTSRLAPAALLLLILVLAASLAAPARVHAALGLEPGIYQNQGMATCQLKPLADGSWQMLFWQGASLDGPQGGYIMLGRLVGGANLQKLSGTWQSLPGSCCPGRGRMEIEVLDPVSFRFSVFTTSLERQAWNVLPSAEFQKRANLKPAQSSAQLTGAWRVVMFYTDLLPGQVPADAVEGKLELKPEGAGASGQWQGRPGKVSLVPRENRVQFSYRDAKAGFELSASLGSEAGGLVYGGEFNSTLGQGRLRLIRAGLPAEPPGLETGQGQGLSGLWVDPRTGSDFYEIKGSPMGFDFTIYGGQLSKPRYLSKGRARPTGQGSYQGPVRDQAGYCCGNQGRVSFRRLDDDKLQVVAQWWPQGQPQPQGGRAEPFVIQRVKRPGNAGQVTARPGSGGRWPVVMPPQPGLLAPQSGAVRVRFSWRPGQTKKEETLFSQGGYLRDMDIFISPRATLGARLRWQGGALELKAKQALTSGGPHEALFSYQAAKKAVLYLDGKQVASAPLPGPWTGSNSPYLVGGSRWPGRGFSGDISQVALWRTAMAPGQDASPALEIAPPPPGVAPGEGPAPGQALTRTLVRLWHPGRLLHAYAVGKQNIARLVEQGFETRGPVGRLAASPEKGAQPLYAYRHRFGGFITLGPSAQAPEGADSLGLLGYIWPNAADQTTALYQLSARLADPLRGGAKTDTFITSRPENLAAAQAAGYGDQKLIGYVKPESEPDFIAPRLYSWSGGWQGEGWGRFFITRKGDELFMFWYYGRMDGKRFFGRYHLSPDGTKAEGVAVGDPGPKATYFRHQLVFNLQDAKGPRIQMTSWRLAAPLDDGRLVRFNSPAAKKVSLQKTSQAIPAEAVRILGRELIQPGLDPEALYQQALKDAAAQDRLVERN